MSRSSRDGRDGADGLVSKAAPRLRRSETQADNRYKRLKKERRLGIVPVDIEVMAQHLITPKTGVKVTGLPIDAVFMTAFYAPMRNGLMMVYGHESFNKVPEGQELPLLDVYYTEYRVITAASTDVKPERT